MVYILADSKMAVLSKTAILLLHIYGKEIKQMSMLELRIQHMCVRVNMRVIK